MDAIVQRIPKGNAETFISIMDLIKESYHSYSRISLYVDNAKWHKARLVKDYLSQQDTIELNFFPPYLSPPVQNGPTLTDIDGPTPKLLVVDFVRR
jgi:hypothetical protein